MTLSGILYALAFVVLGSAMDVYLAAYFQNNPPLVVTLYTFAFGALFFLSSLGKRIPASAKKAQQALPLFSVLNIVTAINWISFFLALKLIEPVVAGAIAFSLLPSISALLSRVLRPERKASARETISSFGIFLSIGAMIAGAYQVGAASHSVQETILGVLLSITAAAGMSTNSFVTKRLSEKGFNTREVMAFRFPAIVLISAVICVVTGETLPIDAAFFGLMAVLSILTVVVPMILIQRGMERTEPMIASILLALSPGATLLFELIEGRIDPPWLSIAGSLLCCAFAIYGVRPQPKN